MSSMNPSLKCKHALVFSFEQLHPHQENILVQGTEHQISLYYKTHTVLLQASPNLLDLNTAMVPKEANC